MTTAEQLLKEYEDATEKKKTLPWARPRRYAGFFSTPFNVLNDCLGLISLSMTRGSIVCSSSIFTRLLTYIDKELAVCGLGVHNAGMTMDDRRLTEELYLNGSLRVLVATSVSVG